MTKTDRQTESWPALTRQIAALSESVGGRVGIAAEHLTTGRRFAQKGDEPFPMASTFKIAVAGSVLNLVDRGKRSLVELIAVEDAARVNSEIIASHLLHSGVALSIHNLIELMLTLSDNTASDVLTTVAGGPAGVTEWLRALGITEQRADRDTAGLTLDFFDLGPGPAQARLRAALAANPALELKADLPHPTFEDDPRDTSTPNAMVRLLAKIQRGEALSAHSTDVLLQVLGRCRTGDNRLRGLLPLKTSVAHKTGTIGGVCNDVGLVTLPDGSQLAIAVFISKSNRLPAERERAIAEISRTLFDAFLLFD